MQISYLLLCIKCSLWQQSLPSVVHHLDFRAIQPFFLSLHPNSLQHSISLANQFSLVRRSSPTLQIFDLIPSSPRLCMTYIPAGILCSCSRRRWCRRRVGSQPLHFQSRKNACSQSRFQPITYNAATAKCENRFIKIIEPTGNTEIDSAANLGLKVFFEGGSDAPRIRLQLSVKAIPGHHAKVALRMDGKSSREYSVDITDMCSLFSASVSSQYQSRLGKCR